MALEPLTFHNPEYVTWPYENLHFVLLGGIRVEGLHSMRVTLKVEYPSPAGGGKVGAYPSLRYSADLYNEGQVEKLVKKLAERFLLSPEYVQKALGHLINTVEDYRLRQLEALNTERSNLHDLSTTDRPEVRTAI
jgi:hypothetical protein